MKNITLFRFLFSFILIGLFSCEQEPVNQIEIDSVEPINEVQVMAPELSYVKDIAIPDIMEKIHTRTLDGESKQTAGKISYNNVDIDLEEIMQVVAEGNEINYTFALDVKNGPKHHIYNLVIGKDAQGNTKEPYVVGYEMKPKDMKAFFENGEDYSKFKAVSRYYTFDSFFQDSKNNKVGKNGDCGTSSSGGGNPTSNTPSGGSFTHSYQGTGVSNVFNVGTPQTYPYNYTVTITNGNQTTSSATTAAQTAVNTITAGISQTGSTITADLPNYSSTTTTYSTHVSVAPDNSLGSGGGGSVICITTVTIIEDIRIETTVCEEANNNKSYTGKTSKTGDCVDTEGAIAINTAAKPVKKLFYALGGSLSEIEIDHFNKYPEQAKAIVQYLISSGFSEDSKEKAKRVVNTIKEDLFLVPSCRSFEYADGISNGLPAKVCGVGNILNTFATVGVEPDGSPFYHSFTLNIPVGYFSVSPIRTNGSAANQTAAALRGANIATKAWFLANPKASSDLLIQTWQQNIKSAMRIIGGNFTENPSFSIRSIAPYTEEFSWLPTDCR